MDTNAILTFSAVYLTSAGIAFFVRQYVLYVTRSLRKTTLVLSHKLTGMLRYEPSIGGKETGDLGKMMKRLDSNLHIEDRIYLMYKLEIVFSLCFTLLMAYAKGNPYNTVYLVGIAIIQLPLLLMLMRQISLDIEAVKFKHEGV